MLKAHKNRLYEVAKEAGFRADQFETDERQIDFADGVGLGLPGNYGQ